MKTSHLTFAQCSNFLFRFKHSDKFGYKRRNALAPKCLLALVIWKQVIHCCHGNRWHHHRLLDPDKSPAPRTLNGAEFKRMRTHDICSVHAKFSWERGVRIGISRSFMGEINFLHGSFVRDFLLDQSKNAHKEKSINNVF